MALTDYVKEMEDETNEKFFLVTNDIAEIRHIEQLMAENQNKNWKIIEEQFQTIEINFHVLRDCTQIFYCNQQLNFNLDTAASLLNLVYADVKSYKAALYAFKKQSVGLGAHITGSEVDNIFDATRITACCLELSI